MRICLKDRVFGNKYSRVQTSTRRDDVFSVMKAFWLNQNGGMDRTYLTFLQDEWKLRSISMFYLLSLLSLSADVDALQVIGGDVTVLQGGTVTLPCKILDTKENLTQISWQRMTRQYPQNDNFFTILSVNGPQFFNGRDPRLTFIGNIKDNIGNLQISNVTLMDEGNYTCIFTLFPSGNHKTAVQLNLHVPPVTSLKDNHVILGEKEVSLVTCTAAGSRPRAEVRWQTLPKNVRPTTTSTYHANGTTTTISSLLGVPTREISQRSVHCVITSAALPKEETLSTTIQVNFSPTEVTIQERSKNSFECVAESNPPANFTWTRPNAARTDGATLHFPSMTSDLNGVYQCEASNPYGKKYHKLYVHMTEGACTVCWTLFGLLLFLNAALPVLWYFYKSGTFTRRGEATFRAPADCQREEPQASGSLQQEESL